MAKQARAQRTYDRILASAAAEFARHGYTDANLLRVAQQIGVTKGALYGHFDSKETLAAALAARLDEALKAVADEPHPAEAAVPARLRALAVALAERVESDIRVNAALRLAVDSAQAGEEPPEFATAVRRHALDLLREGPGPAAAAADALADLLVAVLIGAYYTASAVDRHGLSARVGRMWDAALDPAGKPSAR